MYIEEDIKEKVQQLLERMPNSMGHVLGIEFLSFSKNEVSARMPVNDNTVQPFGILHGGASVALAESLASIGALLNVDDTKTAVGIEINANHIRSVPRGQSVTGTAQPLKMGRKIHLWEVRIVTEEDKLVCISRCTLMVVDRKS